MIFLADFRISSMRPGQHVFMDFSQFLSDSASCIWLVISTCSCWIFSTCLARYFNKDITNCYARLDSLHRCVWVCCCLKLVSLTTYSYEWTFVSESYFCNTYLHVALFAYRCTSHRLSATVCDRPVVFPLPSCKLWKWWVKMCWVL